MQSKYSIAYEYSWRPLEISSHNRLYSNLHIRNGFAYAKLLSGINIPQNFNSELQAILFPLNMMWGLQQRRFWWEWNDIAHVFSVFKIRSFLWNQNSILCWSTSSSLSTTNILVSSTYKTKFTPWKIRA
jgi:hypothetical protein